MKAGQPPRPGIECNRELPAGSCCSHCSSRLLAAFFRFDLARFFSLDHFSSQLTTIGVWYEAHPWQTVLIYFSSTRGVTALSLPGAPC